MHNRSYANQTCRRQIEKSPLALIEMSLSTVLVGEFWAKAAFASPFRAASTWRRMMPSSLLMVRFRSPSWTVIGDAHLADKLAYFYGHGRSSAAALRFPSPIRSKSRTVPTDYGLWSDDCKCAIHLGKQSADASQYQPVNRHKSKSLRISASQHSDLLRNLRPQQVAGNPKDQSTQI